MANFLLLIHGSTDMSGFSKEDFDVMHGKYYAFTERLRTEGRYLDGEALQHTGSTITSAGITDGPYTESKEVVGGYYKFTANDLAEAAQIAKDCPAVEYGGKVEVRQVVIFG